MTVPVREIVSPDVAELLERALRVTAAIEGLVGFEIVWTAGSVELRIADELVTGYTLAFDADRRMKATPIAAIFARELGH